MQVGDLVRNTFNGQIGIIADTVETNGPWDVWRVIMNDGKIRRFQKYQMEVISASR